MPRIFISYRRTDSSAITGRIYDRLVSAFGAISVFKDVDDIPPGVDFRKVLENEVGRADVLLVIIGRQWANVTDEHGQRRLDDPNDFVRIEIETSLNRDDIVTIPVLVDNVQMPNADELPESLRDLRFRNAVPVRNDPDFNRDITRLIHHLRPINDNRKLRTSVPARRTLMLGSVFIIGLVLSFIAAALIIGQNGANAAATQSAVYQAGTIAAQNTTSASLSNRVGTLEVLTATFFPSNTPTEPSASATPPQPTATARFTDDDLLTSTPNPPETESNAAAVVPTAAMSSTIYGTTTRLVYAFSGPSSSDGIAFDIPANTDVEVLGMNAPRTAYRIRYQNSEGWLHAGDFALPADASPLPAISDVSAISLTGNSLVFSSPNYDGSQINVIFSISGNSQLILTAVDRTHRFYRIEYQDQEGWVASERLNLYGDVSQLEVIDVPTNAPLIYSFASDMTSAPQNGSIVLYWESNAETASIEVINAYGTILQTYQVSAQGSLTISVPGNQGTEITYQLDAQRNGAQTSSTISITVT